MKSFNLKKHGLKKDVWQGGILANLFHTKNISIMRYSLKKGFKFQDEGHTNEQITIVLTGKYKFSVNGKTKIMKPWDAVHIEANEKHGGEALTAVTGIDIFFPKRKEKKYQIKNI